VRKFLDFGKGKLNKIKLNKLFYDDKLIFLFSVLISFIIWLGISAGGSDSPPVTVSDIPVSISLSDSAVQDGLKIFSGQNTKAQINISGNKLIVGQVGKDDILITVPQATTITSPGTYTLELAAKKTGMISNYEFASGVQPNFITIMVDRYREAEFNIEPEIDFSANPNYFLGATVLSSPKVVLAGPESEISKIKKICVKGQIDKELQSTFTAKFPLIMYDAYGEQIISETISSTVKEVDVTIPVLVKKNLPVNLNFKNAPQGFSLFRDRIKIEPSSLEIAGTEEQISAVDSIELDPIDFSEINVQHNKIELQVNLPNGCRSLNNVYSIEVSVDTTGFKERSFWVNQISFSNVPEGKNVKAYTDKLEVKLVGPSNSIKHIDAENISVDIDLEGKSDLNGAMEVPAKITAKNYNDVWAYGKYLINIEIS
jgi:Uncharacterized protein conserved in bacteria